MKPMKILLVIVLCSFIGCIGYNKTVAEVFPDGIYNCSINQENVSEICFSYSTGFYKNRTFTKNSENFTEEILKLLKNKELEMDMEIIIYVKGGKVVKID